MNRPSQDLDVATSAPPDLVESLFGNTLSIGKAFGTIVVVQGKISVEVTTFRKDGEYLDGRHPDGVIFSDEKEDASRRDFTINAIFYDPLKDRVLDYFGGVKDIEGRILKAVGDPWERFKEDKLRMLRALRFESQLGFFIDQQTFSAMSDYSKGISQISKERVFNELQKMADGPYHNLAFSHLVQLDIWHNFVGITSSQVKPDIQDFKNFGMNGLKAMLSFLLWWHKEWEGLDLSPKWKDWPLSREVRQFVEETLLGTKILSGERPLFEKFKAFDKSTGIIALQLWKVDNVRKQKSLNEITDFIQSYLEVCDKSGRLPFPILVGKDLIEAEIKPGPNFKGLLDRAFEIQIIEGLTSKNKIIQRILQSSKNG